MKKLLSLAIVLVLLVSTVPVFATAAVEHCEGGWLVKIEADGTIELSDGFELPDGFKWTIDGDTVTFSQPVSFCVKASTTNSGTLTGKFYTVDFENQGGNNPDISYVVIYEFFEEDEGEWCSPGYWRQTQHLDSWVATGYSPDDLFFDALGYYLTLSKLGVTNGASVNPTLLQVLQAPQYYGGGAFNAVGDLLSDSHPDVNFLGTRVEDSCPLN